MPAIELVVCMGSACFARGNTRTLDLVQRYLKDVADEGLVDGSAQARTEIGTTSDKTM